MLLAVSDHEIKYAYDVRTYNLTNYTHKYTYKLLTNTISVRETQNSKLQMHLNTCLEGKWMTTFKIPMTTHSSNQNPTHKKHHTQIKDEEKQTRQ